MDLNAVSLNICTERFTSGDTLQKKSIFFLVSYLLFNHILIGIYI